MKRIISLFLVVSLMFSGLKAVADEGMWLLSLIDKNYEEMKAQGFKLTPEDIYSVNQSSLKDAIVGFGRENSPFSHFCTAEIVSDQGLLLTNHHCGYDMIQNHSTVENDYLKDGFWAETKKDELKNEGITGSILVRMKDVSEKVLAELNEEMSESERNNAIKEASDKIIEKAEEGNNYSAQVIDMFDNNQYFLFVYNIYKDIRLVGAPPEDMGKFGGDTDNWSWPRHTADFSMFRIYTGPDGEPAKYSEDNVPLEPKNHLSVSLKGVDKGDFAMIMGFPGGTDRYITSFGLKETMEVTNQWRYKIRDVKLDIMRKDMKADHEVKLKYASKYAQSSNYWKYSREQNKALRDLKTMERKKEIEGKYKNWAENQRTKKYRNVLDTIEKVYEIRREDAYGKQFLLEALLIGPELPLFAYQNYGLLSKFEKDDLSDEKKKQVVSAMKEKTKEFYKNYHAPTERKMISALFDYFAEHVEEKYYPKEFAEVYDKYDGDFDEYVEDVFTKSFFNPKSIFADKESMMEFLENPKGKTLEKDPIYKMGISIINKYRNVAGRINQKSKSLERARRLFLEGLMEVRDDFDFYPDANSTIRLTYGTVKGYEPRDAVYYEYETTLEGVMEKADPDDMEFDIPKRLRKLYNKRAYGRYQNKEGKLPVCFITDNDITGGNSGSPVMDGKGNMIGIAFDGNTEAMSGDIEFEHDLQRCINLDIRYTLWIIDKFAEADHLVEEMSIVE